jgi:hypothetical protein
LNEAGQPESSRKSSECSGDESKGEAAEGEVPGEKRAEKWPRRDHQDEKEAGQ